MIDNWEKTVPYHVDPKSELANCSHYILHDKKEASGAKLINPRLCSAHASWVLDCIARFSLNL